MSRQPRFVCRVTLDWMMTGWYPLSVPLKSTPRLLLVPHKSSSIAPGINIHPFVTPLSSTFNPLSMGNKLSLSISNPFRRAQSSTNVSEVIEPENGTEEVASTSGEQVAGQQPQELQGAEISSNVTGVNGANGDEQVSGSDSSAKVNGTNGEEVEEEKDNEAEGKEYVFKPVTVPETNGHSESQGNHDGFSSLDLEQINSHINFGSQQIDAAKLVAGEVDEMESLTESESIHSLADSDHLNGSGRNMRKRKNDSPISNSSSPGKKGKKVNLANLPPNAVYVESSDRPFICGVSNCTWAFKQLFHLQRHYKKVHEGKSQNSSGRSSVTGSSISTGEAIYQQALNELVVEYPSEYVQV